MTLRLTPNSRAQRGNGYPATIRVMCPALFIPLFPTKPSEPITLTISLEVGNGGSGSALLRRNSSLRNGSAQVKRRPGARSAPTAIAARNTVLADVGIG